MPPVESLARPVTFLSEDSVRLRGSYHEARELGAVSLLLVHDVGTSRSFWDAYVPLFRSRGWSVLTFDLRGHGESLRQDTRGALLSVEPAHAASSFAYPADVRAALAYLGRQPKTDRRRIAAVGVGLGADLAYAASARGWGATSTVLIGVDDERAKTFATGGAFAPRNIYLIHGDDDGAAVASAPAFLAAAGIPAEVKTYPGGATGPALWEERQPEILARTIAWIERTT